MALAITRSDPGDNLDLTRNTPIWTLVGMAKGAEGAEGAESVLSRGEGLGRHSEGGQAAIYAYAQQLLRENLGCLEPGKNSGDGYSARRATLAEHYFNAAFGVVEGLSYWVQPVFPNRSAPQTSWTPSVRNCNARQAVLIV